MKYEYVRESIRSGDVISVRGTGIAPRLIMLATRGNVSHSAMALWIGEGLWIWEIREGVATRAMRLTPASLYFEDQLMRKRRIWWSQAPEVVRNDNEIEARALAVRHRSYGWSALFMVIWSQWLGRMVRTRQVVCSVAIQRLWEKSGVKFTRLASPEYLKSMCEKHIEIIK